ncbi:hypothetical protein SAMN05421504_1011392 [Amycolatopsis xylanica]|uniref:Uncharacterized protein n=1 Tax=Amycolatopsis xylanica TaxID=589385 RepID=A0A1H2W0X1_9PSEU|nr:hypothetical protein [Amycolatopsis xylanica]SDW74203.1 hypothetical protein SAMN05421504_1011392 [Amycolatopsis xylanica]
MIVLSNVKTLHVCKQVFAGAALTTMFGLAGAATAHAAPPQDPCACPHTGKGSVPHQPYTPVTPDSLKRAIEALKPAPKVEKAPVKKAAPPAKRQQPATPSKPKDKPKQDKNEKHHDSDAPKPEKKDNHRSDDKDKKPDKGNREDGEHHDKKGSERKGDKSQKEESHKDEHKRDERKKDERKKVEHKENEREKVEHKDRDDRGVSERAHEPEPRQSARETEPVPDEPERTDPAPEVRPAAKVKLATYQPVGKVQLADYKTAKNRTAATTKLARKAADEPPPPRDLYTVDFPVQDRGLPLYVGADVVLKELERCFNCSFPIDGAPAHFPAEGEHLPLSACVLPGICMDAPVKSYKLMENGQFKGLRFVAEPGHFDGAGSTIEFRFGNDASGKLVLNVQAKVVDPAVPDFVNKAVASYKWSDFADALSANIREHQGVK